MEYDTREEFVQIETIKKLGNTAFVYRLLHDIAFRIIKLFVNPIPQFRFVHAKF